MVRVYVNGDMEIKLKELREWMEEKEKKIRIVIAGDLNARKEVSEGWVWNG